MNTQPETRPLSRTKIRIVTFGLLLLFSGVYSVYDVMVAYPKTPLHGSAEPVMFSVPKGMGPAQLTKSLAAQGLIAEPGKFSLWMKITGEFAGIRAGEFSLSRQMSPLQIIQALHGKGTGKGVRVTIPEGYTLSQLAEVLEKAHLVSKAQFRDAASNGQLLKRLGIPGDSAEGFLFPDTYYFDKTATAQEIVERMHSNFLQKTANLSLPGDPKLLEVVTLASIVQAEAKAADEAEIIAGVYRNRLNPQKFPSRRLQADPTVSYGCNEFVKNRPDSCATFKGTLGSRQLNDASNRYNTYRNPGLPPTPICAPGLNALKAALSPKDVPYLYFVVSAAGRHQFSTTLEEHEKAVDAYRKSRDR